MDGFFRVLIQAAELRMGNFNSQELANSVITHISRALKRALRRDNEYYCLMNIKNGGCCC